VPVHSRNAHRIVRKGYNQGLNRFRKPTHWELGREGRENKELEMSISTTLRGARKRFRERKTRAEELIETRRQSPDGTVAGGTRSDNVEDVEDQSSGGWRVRCIVGPWWKRISVGLDRLSVARVLRLGSLEAKAASAQSSNEYEGALNSDIELAPDDANVDEHQNLSRNRTDWGTTLVKLQ
jgi:hypothetical protein